LDWHFQAIWIIWIPPYACSFIVNQINY
jgi:hypothetical protein